MAWFDVKEQYKTLKAIDIALAIAYIREVYYV